ncbi:hypothetical protein HDU96_008842 [Phlyctochytrium bullatum]|nr:hypothetical protein HDU96_008842 [Phlyctochytrium bullatum]
MLQDLSVFAARHVSDILRDEGRAREMEKALMAGKPYTEDNEFLAVVIFDICGFTALSTALVQALGSVSSEAITEAVGEYLNKITKVVIEHGGDVVKVRPPSPPHHLTPNQFLGDAILVSFHPTPPTEPRVTFCRRVLLSCHDVLTRCGRHEANLTRWTRVLANHTRGGDRLSTPTRTNSYAAPESTSGNVSYSAPGGGVNPADPRTTVLTLHVAVTVGAVTRVVLGDPRRKLDYFLWGSPLDDLARLLEAAKSGQVGVSESVSKEVWSVHLAEGCEEGIVMTALELSDALKIRRSTHELPIVSPQPSRTPSQRRLAHPLLRAFVNGSVLHQLETLHQLDSTLAGLPSQLLGSGLDMVAAPTEGPGGLRTEFRTISVLMVRLLGEIGLDQLQTIVAGLMGLAERDGGTYYQCSVDDKGKTIMSCFGLPPVAAAKPPIAAMNTALSLQRLCESVLGAPASMSVTTGSVLFGVLGSETRKEVCLLGDVFNTAARIVYTERSDRFIAVDSDTAEVAQSEFFFHELGLFKFKGKNDPIKVLGLDIDAPNSARRLLTARKAFTNDAAEILAHSDEWLTLKQGVEAWVEETRDRFTGVVEGEGGLGKTWLLCGLREVAAENGRRVCLCKGIENDRSRPFSAIQQILLHILDFLRATTDAPSDHPKRSASMTTISVVETFSNVTALVELIRAGLEACGESTEAEAMAVADVLFLQRSSDAESGEAETRKTVAVAAVGRLMKSFFGVWKGVFCVDDFQWVDSASQQILLACIAASPKICALVFSRPLDRRLRAELDGFDYQSRLQGLSVEQMHRFIVQSGIPKVDEEAVKVMHDRTGGNLLEVDSLVRYIKEVSPNLLRLEAQNPILATELRTIVMFQLDRLPAFYRHILRLASIFGQYFSAEDILILLGSGSTTADAIKDEIHKSDSFHFVRVDESGGLYFRHIMIQEAIYESISVSERESSHLKVAEHIERGISGEEKLSLDVLHRMCYHFWRSGNVEKMIKYNYKLGCLLVSNIHIEEATAVLIKVFSFEEEAQYLSLHERAMGFAMVLENGLFRLPVDEVVKYGLKSIALSGYQWPEDPKTIRKLTAKAIWTFMVLWARSKGGRRDIRKDKWYGVKLKALRYLLHVGTIFVGTFSADQVTLICIWTLSQAIEQCRTRVDEWFTTLCYVTYFLSYHPSAENVQRFFTKRLWEIQPLCSDAKTEAFGGYPAMLNCCLELPRESAAFLNEAMDFFAKEGKWVYYIRAFSNLLTANVVLGELWVQNTYPFEKILEHASSKEPQWAASACVSLQYECFLVGNVERLRYWESFCPEEAKALPIETRLMFLFFVNTPACMDAIMCRDMDSADHLYEKVAAFLQEIASSPMLVLPHLIYLMLLVLLMGIDCWLAAAIPGSSRRRELSRALIAPLQDIQRLCASTRNSRFIYPALAYRLLQCSMALSYAAAGEAPWPNAFGKEAARWARRKLQQRSYRKKFAEGGDLFFLGALLCSILAKVSAEKAQRKLYAKRAMQMFGTMGADTMVRWMEKDTIMYIQDR